MYTSEKQGNYKSRVETNELVTAKILQLPCSLVLLQNCIFQQIWNMNLVWTNLY